MSDGGGEAGPKVSPGAALAAWGGLAAEIFSETHELSIHVQNLVTEKNAFENLESRSWTGPKNALFVPL